MTDVYYHIFTALPGPLCDHDELTEGLILQVRDTDVFNVIQVSAIESESSVVMPLRPQPQVDTVERMDK